MNVSHAHTIQVPQLHLVTMHLIIQCSTNHNGLAIPLIIIQCVFIILLSISNKYEAARGPTSWMFILSVVLEIRPSEKEAYRSYLDIKTNLSLLVSN